MADEPDNEAPQTIEELTQRFNHLNTQRIQAEANLKNAQNELAKLKTKARQEYGTDDLEELKTKLADMKRSNEEARAAYQASLDTIESQLSEIDDEYRSAESDNE